MRHILSLFLSVIGVASAAGAASATTLNTSNSFFDGVQIFMGKNTSNQNKVIVVKGKFKGNNASNYCAVYNIQASWYPLTINGTAGADAFYLVSDNAEIQNLRGQPGFTVIPDPGSLGCSNTSISLVPETNFLGSDLTVNLSGGNDVFLGSATTANLGTGDDRAIIPETIFVVGTNGFRGGDGKDRMATLLFTEPNKFAKLFGDGGNNCLGRAKDFAPLNCGGATFAYTYSDAQFPSSPTLNVTSCLTAIIADPLSCFNVNLP